MDFLKRHYEKIGLTIILVMFVFALAYLISTFLKAGKVSKSDLKIKEKTANYQHLDFKKGFHALKQLDKSQYIRTRKKSKKAIADFMTVLPIMYFPPSKKYIPKSLMGKKDPFSGLVVYKKKIIIGEPVGQDVDNDHIPDVIEKKFGLNFKDPNDAALDLDEDGFSNLEEYQAKTNLNDAKSHPLFVTRLRIVKFPKTLLPVVVTQLDAKNDDREAWEMTLSVKETLRGHKKTRWKKLNDLVQIGGDSYKVVDIIPSSKKEIVSGLEMEKDTSMIIFQNVLTGEKVTARVKEKVYAPKLRVTLKNLMLDRIPKRLRKLVEGQEFYVGNVDVGQEKYKILKIQKGQSITVIGAAGKFEITKEGVKKLP